MLYVVAIVGEFWCAELLALSIATFRFVLAERQPLHMRQAQEVAAQAWRAS